MVRSLVAATLAIEAPPSRKVTRVHGYLQHIQIAKFCDNRRRSRPDRSKRRSWRADGVIDNLNGLPSDQLEDVFTEADKVIEKLNGLVSVVEAAKGPPSAC